MGVEGEERFQDEEGMIHDDYRIDFISEHLKWVHQAIQEGSHVKGYHLWTFMDNWSWSNAYKNRYGFVSVDLEEDGKRTIKKVAIGFNRFQRIMVSNQDTCSFLEKGKYFSYVKMKGLK